jgi:hypothetical protein
MVMPLARGATGNCPTANGKCIVIKITLGNDRKSSIDHNIPSNRDSYPFNAEGLP